MTSRKKLHAEERLRVAAAQQWKCGTCAELLPSAFEIDHIIELADGGSDKVSNMQALCGSCHALKSQRSRILRYRRSAVLAGPSYDNRNDHVINPNTVQCEECLQRRPLGSPHPVCWAIESKLNPAASDARLQIALAGFQFMKR
ncbi:MAG: hypothetical protein CL678_00875 [Bdellovibrionaceae bacterium]|nr:hypothetical protein [Pseudobdellovibrionaceae bacterium]